MDDELKTSMTAGDTWTRALFMFLFALIYSVAEIVLVAVVLIQFLFVLITREKNERLLDFGEDLAVFIFQVLQFQTFNTEERPFPFGPWPYGSDDYTFDGTLDGEFDEFMEDENEMDKVEDTSEAPESGSAPAAKAKPKAKRKKAPAKKKPDDDVD